MHAEKIRRHVSQLRTRSSLEHVPIIEVKEAERIIFTELICSDLFHGLGLNLKIFSIAFFSIISKHHCLLHCCSVFFFLYLVLLFSILCFWYLLLMVDCASIVDLQLFNFLNRRINCRSDSVLDSFERVW